MKKFIVAVLTLVMLLSIAAVVSAEAKSFTIYNVPCEAIADSELYRYHGDQFVNKYDTDGKLKVMPCSSIAYQQDYIVRILF